MQMTISEASAHPVERNHMAAVQYNASITESQVHGLVLPPSASYTQEGKNLQI